MRYAALAVGRIAGRPTGLRGFTLIEILVVIVIIALLVSVAAVAVGVLGRDTQVEEHAKRFWAVLSQAKEEAELQSRNLGVIVDESGYEFVQFDARKWIWQPVAGDELLAPRRLPPGLQLTLRLEGREVVLKPRQERTSSDAAEEAEREPAESKSLEDAPMAPHIMLLASGDVNVFDLQVEREESEYRWHVFSKADNTIDYGVVDATL